MTLVHSIKSALGFSRVEFSSSFSKSQKRLFSYMPKVEKMAAEKDVFVKIQPSKEHKAYSNVQILKRGVDHVADIPEYALAHDTGDQVYINWTKELGSREVPSNEFAISNVLKMFTKEV